MALLDPDVVLRADGGPGRSGASAELFGIQAVAERAHRFAALGRFARPALVNGAAGVVVAPRGRPFAVIGITVTDGKIAEIDILSDPARLRELDLTVFED